MDQMVGDPAFSSQDLRDLESHLEVNLEGGSSELDNMLDGAAPIDDFQLTDTDFQELLDGDNNDLAELDMNEDHLANMPFVEVDEVDLPALFDDGKRRGGPMSPNKARKEEAMNRLRQQQQQQQQGYVQGGVGDPLFGNFDNSHNRTHSEVLQVGMQGMSLVNNDVGDDALSRMLVQHEQEEQQQQQGLGMGGSLMDKLEQGQGVDLEQEKMKLMQQLSEINQKQQEMTTSQTMMMQQQLLQLQQQQQMQQQMQQIRKQPLVASVASATAGGGGESALQAFLRNKGNKDSVGDAGPARPTTTAGLQALLQAKGGIAPQAASIFSEAPMEVEGNMFSAVARLSEQSASQIMAQRLSSSSLNHRQALGSNDGIVGGGHSRNATWGNNTNNVTKASAGFRTSGILPKHASDNHLLRAAGNKGSLMRSRNSRGSLSRENNLYSMIRKTSSKNLLNREESFGSLLPAKRRGGAKHRLGSSLSVPHMMINSNYGGGGAASSGSKNAMW